LFVHVVNPDMPLKVVGPRIPVLLVRTKGTYIARRVVNQAMADHLIFAFESLSALASVTASLRTEVRTIGRVNVGMRVQEVLGLERRRVASGIRTSMLAAARDMAVGLG
jgi:hypothetical protein